MRAYQVTLDDDKDDGPNEQQRASKFNPPFDGAESKLRWSGPDGRDFFEARAGYAYQHSDPNTVDGYHTTYLSGDYYFGAPIASGIGSRSRRLDVLVRLGQNTYAAAGRAPEVLVQFVPEYTVPLNGDGTTRMYASYARELRLDGSNAVRTPSNRFEVGAYRDPTRWLEFYGRFSVFATRGISGAARIVGGVQLTI